MCNRQVHPCCNPLIFLLTNNKSMQKSCCCLHSFFVCLFFCLQTLLCYDCGKLRRDLGGKISWNSFISFALSLAPLTVLVVFFFSCTLFHSSLARSFTPSSSSCASSSLLSYSPHITSLSSPLPSLSFLFTFILLEKTHPFALFSLLPCYSVLSFSPLPNSTPSPATSPFMSWLPFYIYFLFFWSFLLLLLLHPFFLLLFVRGCSHLICWNTLPSRGRDQPQPISHMAEYAVCQWCMYAAGGGGATHG